MSNQNGTERNMGEVEVVTDRFAEAYHRAAALASHAQQCVSLAAAGEDRAANIERAYHSTTLLLSDFDALDSIATTPDERHWLATEGATIRANAKRDHASLAELRS